MASRFLGKWFGGSQAPAPQVADALAELAKLTQPSLAASCDVLRSLLPELFNAPVREAVPTLDSNVAREKLAGGTPLLRGESVNFDEKSLRRRWQGVCIAVAPQNNDADAVADAFASLDPAALLIEVLAGRTEAVTARAEDVNLNAPLTATVLRFTAYPVLAHIAAALAPLRSQTTWDQGNCPTCGSWPLLGEFRGLEQLRFLRCGLCASEWQFPRLRCPFCDNRDHHRLGFFHIEGQENRYRAATCEQCHGYVKMVATLAPLTEPQLLVADLGTLYLDLAAAERGYLVP